MDLKQLFTDDDAVSPVIGVILMVAITVILAAVIASLVLGLGDEPTQTPSAQFEFDYDDSSDTNTLTIEHNGGNTIPASEIEIRGDAGDEGEDLSDTGWGDVADDTDASDVSTGSTAEVEVGNDYDITVTWVPPGGGDTSPLASDSGPEA